MYKIVQNSPVIVKQSTNLLKITQGSLFFCTKVNLCEKTYKLETGKSKCETSVLDKKKSGKKIEENTPPVIYLPDTLISNYPMNDIQFHVNTSSSYETDPKVSNKTELKSDVILLHDKNDEDFLRENLSEKSSNSVLNRTDFSNNYVQNVAKTELNQESNNQSKIWAESITEALIIDDNRRNNEPKLENLFTQSHSELPNFNTQVEPITSNTPPQLMRLEPCRTEILSSNTVKTNNSEWKTQQFSKKLKAFTPPRDGQVKDTETKQKKLWITNNSSLKFKSSYTIPKIRTRNPIRMQDIVLFKEKPASAPINSNITFSNPIKDRLVNPTTGQSLYKKIADDPILKQIQQKTIVDNLIQNNETKCNITQNSPKKDIKEEKIPVFFHSNPEINKTPIMPQNVDNFYKHLFTELSDDKYTAKPLSTKTAAGVAEAHLAAGVTQNRVLSNTTPTASTEPLKTIKIEKPNSIEKSISSNKSNSQELSSSKHQQTKNLKLNAPKIGIQSQDITSQNIQSNLGGVQFQIPGRLLIAFTCKKCNTRNSKQISKHAYTKGVVIIRCDGCKNNHLIADNLNWFTDMGKKKNIEDIMAEKGEKVKKIDLPGGISEFLTDS